MKITGIQYQRYDLRLANPYTIAYESIEQASNFIIQIETDNGLIGLGCAAPDLPVTGETPEAVEDAIKAIITPYLKGKSPFRYALILEELRGLLNHKPSALAMVDMALFDLIAKKAEVPLYQMLGGYRQRIETSITIGICTVEETLNQAEKYHKEGFNIFKIKGGLEVEADIERMHRLREEYPASVLRFDGNQGYSVETAVRFFEGTRQAKIEIFEQPTKVHMDEKLGAVTEQVRIPVMADESVKSLTDTFRLVSDKRIDMINIKLMKVGGIMEASHINSVAKSDGIEVMVGCMDESALGISAGLHFALSKSNVEYADLDGHLDFIDDPFTGLFRLEKGWLMPNENPGLGIAEFE